MRRSIVSAMAAAALLMALTGCNAEMRDSADVPSHSTTARMLLDEAASARKQRSENELRYRRMLANARVHDRDGYLFDGENAHYNTWN